MPVNAGRMDRGREQRCLTAPAPVRRAIVPAGPARVLRRLHATTWIGTEGRAAASVTTPPTGGSVEDGATPALPAVRLSQPSPE